MTFGFGGWKANFTVEKIPNLQGKVAIVTGANGGLGAQTARELALNGCKVYLGVRSRDRGLAVKETIDTLLSDGKSARYPGGSVEVLPNATLDLSDMPKIRAWAEEFKAHSQRLDILVCPAAIVPAKFTLAANPKHEMTYVTNHLGHFFLVSELYPLLKTSAESSASTDDGTLRESRIAIVSADVTKFMDTFRVHKGRDWCINTEVIDDASKFSRVQAYGRTKVCNVLFARQLAALTAHDSHLVKVNALHPGVWASELFWSESHSRQSHESTPWLERLAKRGMQFVSDLIAMKPEQQALTTLFAATSPEITDNNWHGQFFYPYGHLKTHGLVSLAKDEAIINDLWDISIAQVKDGLGADGDSIFFETLGERA